MNAQNNNSTNEWREAFADAQMTPDAHVWNNIELELARNANGNYKKRILFFKLLAAASVSLAAIIGGTVVYNQFTSLSDEIAVIDNNDDQKSLNNAQSTDQLSNNQMLPSDDNGQGVIGSDGQSEGTNHIADDFDRTKSNVITGVNPEEDNEHNGQVALLINDPKKDDVNSANLVTSKPTYASNSIPASDPNSLDRIGVVAGYDMELLDRELNMVPRLDLAYASNKKSDKIWLGLNFAMGSNSPTGGASQEQAQTLGLSDASGGFQIAEATVSEEQQGSVIIAGLGVGKQLGQRWILESGLAFSKRNTFVKSNLAVANNGRVEALNSFGEASAEGALIFTDNYELQNTYNSISVPLQAGYLIVDGTLDLYVKAGVVNEFLLWNEVQDTDGKYNDVTVNAGSDSPYNVYILNGSVGSELRYQVGGNYHIALVPQLQKSLNSFLKSDENNAGRPLLFTVGLRFKYQFD
ncbi:MAG: hypothetical protein ABJH05_09580 [Fulvivirga sp.]